MTNLDCTVKTCVHNKEHGCCLSNINVDGVKALNEAETCCGSFAEARDSFTNREDKDKKAIIDVGCSAVHCAYNDDSCCHADHIDICGQSANDCEETRCGTFKPF